MNDIIEWLESIKRMPVSGGREEAKRVILKKLRSRPAEMSIDLASFLVGASYEHSYTYSDVWLMAEMKVQLEERGKKKTNKDI